MADGTYDIAVLDWCAREFAQRAARPVAWDIGAHFGYASLCFARMVGSEGMVHSFEPNPANLERLQANLRLNSEVAERITVHPYALAAAEGSARFGCSEDVDGSRSSGAHIVGTQLPLPAAAYSGFHEIEVNVSSVDELLARGEAVPHLMKIDVEGAEASVLKGAYSCLKQHSPALAIEVHHVSAMLDCCRILFGLGYQVEMFDTPAPSTSRAFIWAKRAE